MTRRAALSDSMSLIRRARFTRWEEIASYLAGHIACSRTLPMPISVVTGDLLEQQVDAIVNAWNRNVIPWWLLIPQGVSGAIKRRAGLAPFRELGYRPLPLGGARHTGAGGLPYRGIIHVAAIDMLWRASADSIARATRAACELALQHRYASLALPVLGSGSGGYPLERATDLIVQALANFDGALDLRVVRHAPSENCERRA